MTIKTKKEIILRHLIDFIVISLAILCFFVAGMFFERWGGLDRVLPPIINYVRNNILGDQSVLFVEKKVFSFRDELKQKLHTPSETTLQNLSEAPEIPHAITLQLRNQYLSDPAQFNNNDHNIFKKLNDHFVEHLIPYYENPLPNEGKWEHFIVDPQTLKPLYSKTFIRTDLEREYAIVYLYRFDMDRLKLEFIPGAQDCELEICDGKMSEEQRSKVLWIFSGGYQYQHGWYGMKYKNTVLLPPRKNIQTLFFYQNGSLKITPWHEENPYNKDVVAFRQNEFPLIIDGKINQYIDQRMWGGTPKDVDPIFTMRSGLGLDRHDDLIFAFGDNLSAHTLAKAMVEAGVINGMHLDMNYYNVHLVNITRNKDGRLITGNENNVLSYYRGIYTVLSNRDYFILTAR
ncbi:MAG: hypothetical protein MJB14_20690 [Spirochaetes bacterium]|nr:hypothetical protein [Spirochaetota bacterium]